MKSRSPCVEAQKLGGRGAVPRMKIKINSQIRMKEEGGIYLPGGWKALL